MLEDRNIADDNGLNNTDPHDGTDTAAAEPVDESPDTVSIDGASEDICAKEDTEEVLVPVKKLGLFLKITAFFSFGLALFSVILRICLYGHPEAGEAFYRHVARYLQGAMAAITSFIPFSLAETVTVMLPLFALTVLVFATYRFVKKDTYRLKRTVVCIFIAVCLAVSNFVLNLSIIYCRQPLSVLTGLDSSDIGRDELCAASLISVLELNRIISEGRIDFDDSGASVCPYGYKELDKKIEAAFDSYAERNDWLSPYGANSKIIALSDYMTYTHISGIYTQFTGEANININYPDYVVCGTMAHEKAHQRGIAPEDEANLTAFFVLAESGDPYLEYCGYMSIFSELMSDCYRAAPEFYTGSINPIIPDEIHGEFSAYSLFFKKYRESESSKAVDKINNAYLKFNGESEGVLSYTMTSGMASKYIMTYVLPKYTQG